MNLPHALDGLLALLQVGRGGDGVRAEKHHRAHKVRPLTLQQLYPRRTASTVLTVGRDHTYRATSLGALPPDLAAPWSKIQ